MSMKMQVLYVIIMMTVISIQAQQTAVQPVTAELVSAQVNNEQAERHYKVAVKLKCSGVNPFHKGDTITLLGKNGQYRNTVCKRIVGNGFPFSDSTYTFSFLGYIEDDNTFVEITNLVGDTPHAGRYNSHDTVEAKPKNYIVTLDLTTHIPILGADKFSRLAMDHYPITGQMGFSYYSRNEATLRWSITDLNGRRVRHGFLQVEMGRHSYSLSIDGLPKGRYTFILGEGSDEDEDSFTIL